MRILYKLSRTSSEGTSLIDNIASSPFGIETLKHRRHVKIYCTHHCNREKPHECLLPLSSAEGICHPFEPSAPLDRPSLSEVRNLDDLLQGGGGLHIKRLAVWE